MVESYLPEVDQESDGRDFRQPACGQAQSVGRELIASAGVARLGSNLAAVPLLTHNPIEAATPGAVGTVHGPEQT